jgi:hypothetical protein
MCSKGVPKSEPGASGRRPRSRCDRACASERHSGLSRQAGCTGQTTAERRSQEGLRYLLEALGRHWAVIMTDVARGRAGNYERMAFLFDLRRVKPSGVACELASTSSRRPRWRRQRSTGSSPERLRGELRLQRGRAHARHAARHLRQRAGFSLVRSRTTNSGASGSVGLGGMGLPLASSSLRPSGPKASSHGLGHPVTSAGEDECVRRLKEVLIFGFLRERCGLRSGDLAVHRLAASVQPARLVAIEVGSGGAWQPHG